MLVYGTRYVVLRCAKVVVCMCATYQQVSSATIRYIPVVYAKGEAKAKGDHTHTQRHSDESRGGGKSLALATAVLKL